MSFEEIWAKAQQEQKRQRGPNQHRESDLQKSCVTWFRLQYPRLALLLFAVPNGGQRTRRTYVKNGQVYSYCPEGRKLRQEGELKGVSDLILLKPNSRYASLCIEMKTTQKGSAQSPEQEAWEKAVTEAGNKYVVCRSLDDFMDTIKAYLGG